MREGYTLQKLDDKHRQVAALLAQGLTRKEIAQVVSYTEDYISTLTKEPVFAAYLTEMADFAQTQIESMFMTTVKAIGDGLNSEDSDTSLKAARLQLEVTGRIGKNERANGTNEDSINRLARLAERLTVTLGTMRKDTGVTYDGQASVLQANEQAGS